MGTTTRIATVKSTGKKHVVLGFTPDFDKVQIRGHLVRYKIRKATAVVHGMVFYPGTVVPLGDVEIADVEMTVRLAAELLAQ
jgi:hypothetical protein